MDDVGGVAGGVQECIDGGRPDAGQHGDGGRVEAHGGEAVDDFAAKVVVADCGDDAGVRAHLRGVPADVAGRAAQGFSVGQDVPQNFTEAEGEGAVVHENPPAAVAITAIRCKVVIFGWNAGWRLSGYAMDNSDNT